MESIAPFITAMTMAIAVLAAFWIYRKTDRINSVHCIFAGGIIVYTIYHFLACGMGMIDPFHGAITGIFIASTALINAYCSTCVGSPSIKIGVDRRKVNNIPDRSFIDERRQIDSHPIFKEVKKA